MQTPVCWCARTNEEIAEEAHRKPGTNAGLCQAIETVGGNRVGCKNKAENLKLRRVSQTVKGKVMCAEHIRRLSGHNACGFCGDFCAHVSRPFSSMSVP